jgi:hypothetical protein
VPNLSEVIPLSIIAELPLMAPAEAVDAAAGLRNWQRVRQRKQESRREHPFFWRPQPDQAPVTLGELRSKAHRPCFRVPNGLLLPISLYPPRVRGEGRVEEAPPRV